MLFSLLFYLESGKAIGRESGTTAQRNRQAKCGRPTAFAFFRSTTTKVEERPHLVAAKAGIENQPEIESLLISFFGFATTLHVHFTIRQFANEAVIISKQRSTSWLDIGNRDLSHFQFSLQN